MKATTSRPGQRLSVRCCFCHDDLGGDVQAVYCATCLAPHHSDCFSRHGTCSTPGCQDNRHVSPSTEAEPRSRRVTTGLVLAVGLLCTALVLGGLALRAHQEQEIQRAELLVERMDVLVGARNIEPGSVFTEDDIEYASFPRQIIEQSLRNTQIYEPKSIVGLRTKSPIRAGQVLLDSHFHSGERYGIDADDPSLSPKILSAIPDAHNGHLIVSGDVGAIDARYDYWLAQRHHGRHWFPRTYLAPQLSGAGSFQMRIRLPTGPSVLCLVAVPVDQRGALIDPQSRARGSLPPGTVILDKLRVAVDEDPKKKS
jgi:hypothetical protein